jgi:hypothetical protein
MEEIVELRTNEAWQQALHRWNHPSIPHVIAPRTSDEISNLGEVGQVLRGELAFMKFPEFQTYVNLEKVAEEFDQDPQRGLEAVTKHEAGHRFCPYDTITSILLHHDAQKGLKSVDVPYDKKKAAGLMMNLFTDMCINTSLSRKGDEDIPWAYQEISKKKEESNLWRVYARSMEHAWKKEILPEGTELSENEEQAAKNVAQLFEKDPFDKRKWRGNIQRYSDIMAPFLENEEQDGKSTLDDIAANTPSQLDERTREELAKRLAEVGSDGIPTNMRGLKEFQEVMAGFGQGDPKEASLAFYEMLARAYDVSFATKPFGRPRANPFQPEKWQPSMGAESLDVPYSVLVGGKIIPGISTYRWRDRQREIHGGMEEVVPNLDLYLDSSGTMPDPVEEISLPVLAGFVAARKAERKGAQVRATNFSGTKQHTTQEWTKDLSSVLRTLVTYYDGGTVLPIEKLLEDGDPKQVLVITDTFLGNEDEAVGAIRELRSRHSGNKVTIYALHPVDCANYLRNAGAEVIHGTTTDIFKRTIGKADEVYMR